MFRFEKVFQNDDKFFILISNIIKVLSIYISIYVFSVLEQKTIYDLLNYKIFYNSKYFFFSICLSIIFFLISILNQDKKKYYKYNFKKDYTQLIMSIIISILILIYFEKNMIDKNFFFLLIFLFVILFLSLIFINKIYDFLVDQNIIQKNILLIGNYESIKKIIEEKKNKIYVYKCCIIVDQNQEQIKKIRLNFKIPVFSTSEDIRSLLEYHSLGQIWILKDNTLNTDNALSVIVKYSVDILILNLLERKKNNNFINSKYSFINYEISRFHGFSLFIKILLDKFLSLIFLIILSPILALSILMIYLEDGLPIFFSQDRIGWDGIRFKIYKLRSLKNFKFQRADQVIENDQRLLKIGKFIRKFSIDEVPQFYNVLIGQMSIVGPRPHMVEHDIYYSNIFKEFLKRHKANPGLTGWAQIHGLRGPTTNENLMKKRMDYDLWYLKNWTVLLDIKIIIRTIYAIFRYKGI